MKKLLAAAAACAALAATAPALAQDEETDRYEEAFNDVVEGRTAGEPESCISVFNSNRLRVVENVGLTYRRGDTLWVARARDPQQLGVWDIPIIERHGSTLCRHDITRTIDRSSGIFSGVLFLEDWVPWTEVEDADG